jgi:hypothetical protein
MDTLMLIGLTIIIMLAGFAGLVRSVAKSQALHWPEEGEVDDKITADDFQDGELEGWEIDEDPDEVYDNRPSSLWGHRQAYIEQLQEFRNKESKGVRVADAGDAASYIAQAEFRAQVPGTAKRADIKGRVRRSGFMRVTECGFCKKPLAECVCQPRQPIEIGPRL